MTAEPEYIEEEFNLPEMKSTPRRNNNRYRAMDQLKHIVGTSGLRQDITKVRAAETLNGAKQWAQKHSTRRTKYNATTEDVDGDGVTDVLVKTADGDLVIVNGYTVRNSDYPYRQMFGDLPEEHRKKYSNYKKYLSDAVYGHPGRDPETGRTIWYKNPEEDPLYIRLKNNGFRTFKPKNRTTYQSFISLIVQPQIEELFESDPDNYQIGVIRDADGSTRPKFPNVLLAVAADAWNFGVIRPILEQQHNMKIPIDIPPDRLKAICSDPKVVALKKRSVFKTMSRSIMDAYLKEDYTTNGEFLNSYLKPLNERINRLTESLSHPGNNSN